MIAGGSIENPQEPHCGGGVRAELLAAAGEGLMSMPHPAQQIRFCTSRDGVRIAYAGCGAGPPLVKTANWITHLEFDWESPVWRPWLSALTRHQR